MMSDCRRDFGFEMRFKFSCEGRGSGEGMEASSFWWCLGPPPMLRSRLRSCSRTFSATLARRARRAGVKCKASAAEAAEGGEIELAMVVVAVVVVVVVVVDAVLEVIVEEVVVVVGTVSCSVGVVGILGAVRVSGLE